MRAPRAILLAVAIGAGGCASSRAPGAPLLAWLAGLAPRTAAAPFQRRTATLTIDAPELKTVVTAVAITATRPPHVAAVQLLPPVGGKLVDLRFDGAELRAEWPAAQRSLHWSPALGPAPRGLELFLAASVLEDDTAPEPTRVSAVRGPWIELTPRIADVGVSVRLDAAGRVVARRFRHRGVTWNEEITADGRRFSAPRVTIVVSGERFEALDEVPGALFRIAP